MTNFEMEKTKCLCLILDIAGLRPAQDGRSGYEHVKHALITGLSQLEYNDLIYVYREHGDLKMGKTVNESIAIINDWHHKSINVPVALEECIILTSQYQHTDKSVFYFTDNYKSTNDGLMQESLIGESNDNYCHVYAYGIGKVYSHTLAEHVSHFYHYRHLDDYADLVDSFGKDLNG